MLQQSWILAAGGLAALFVPAVHGYEALGCFHDKEGDRVLGDMFSSRDMTTKVSRVEQRAWHAFEARMKKKVLGYFWRFP